MPSVRFAYRGRTLSVHEFSRLRADGKGSFLLLGDDALIICDTPAEVVAVLPNRAGPSAPSPPGRQEEESAS